MSRIFVYTALLFVTSVSFGGQSLTLLTVIDPISTEAAELDLKQLDRFFEARGFSVLLTDGSSPQTLLQWPHRIYHSPDLKNQVFVRLGAFINEIEANQATDFEGGSVLNRTGNLKYVLYFKGFRTEKLKNF